MREAVIVSGVRTPVGRANKGTLRDTRPDDLAGLVLKEVVARTKGLDPAQVQDVVFGCAFPEGAQGMNVARIAVFKAGLPNTVPGVTVNRFCASGLEAVAMAAQRIVAHGYDIVVAGGVESMTAVPMGGNGVSLNPYLAEKYPEAYTSMGITAENVARRFEISREDMDRFAYESQMKAKAAMEAGKFDSQLVPVETFVTEHVDGKPVRKEVTLTQDECPRPNTTLEGLGKLRPAFTKTGDVTAGNSSPLSDGAAALVLMERSVAEKMGLEIMATFRSYKVGGVDPDVMGIGPTVALPKLMEATGLTVDDIDLFELNEAFASQSLYCIRHLGMDPEKINVNGGAIALGHPLGCTGAKLSVQILHEMLARDVKRGVVTMCIGGGMGAAGLFER